MNTSGNIAGKCGTMKKGKATTRCLPRAKANNMTKADKQIATVAKDKLEVRKKVPNNLFLSMKDMKK